jgi:hypothetical protein
MTELGSQYVAALAAKDTDALLALFAPQVYFRGLTPRRSWEADSPDAVVHEVLYTWFAPDEVIESVDQVQLGRVVDRERVDYRFTVRSPEGLFTVEQRAYFDVDDDDRISRMHVMCSGYQSLDPGVRT